MHSADREILVAAGKASCAACLEARPQLFRVLSEVTLGRGGGERLSHSPRGLLPRRAGQEGIDPQRGRLIGRRQRGFWEGGT